MSSLSFGTMKQSRNVSFIPTLPDDQVAIHVIDCFTIFAKNGYLIKKKILYNTDPTRITMSKCLAVLMCLLSYLSFSQMPKRNIFTYCKMNLTLWRENPENYSFTNFQPAIQLASNTLHEIGLTSLYFGRSYAFQDYRPMRSFRSGLFYLVKRRILSETSRLQIYPGASVSFDYTARHLVPIRPDIHKEMYQDIFTYSAYGVISLGYRINSKFSAECDWPILLWHTQYFLQKDLAPITHEVSYLAD